MLLVWTWITVWPFYIHFYERVTWNNNFLLWWLHDSNRVIGLLNTVLPFHHKISIFCSPSLLSHTWEYCFSLLNGMPNHCMVKGLVTRNPVGSLSLLLVPAFLARSTWECVATLPTPDVMPVHYRVLSALCDWYQSLFVWVELRQFLTQRKHHIELPLPIKFYSPR